MQGHCSVPAASEISPAEKEVMSSWILAGTVCHSEKDNKWFLDYACVIIRYLNHIELLICK